MRSEVKNRQRGSATSASVGSRVGGAATDGDGDGDGDGAKPVLHKELLTFEYVHPSQRSYK